MSIFYPHHQADHQKMCADHSRFTDEVGDSVIKLQDEAYELGRLRGKMEANASLVEVLRKARASIHSTRLGLGEGLDDETRAEIGALDDLVIDIDTILMKADA